MMDDEDAIATTPITAPKPDPIASALHECAMLAAAGLRNWPKENCQSILRVVSAATGTPVAALRAEYQEKLDALAVANEEARREAKRAKPGTATTAVAGLS